jgi:superfamily I DNA/RNA helicase
MAWMISEEKLDPNQKEIFKKPIDRNLWIKGFAGSGKSVLLIHKLRKILKDNPNANTCVVVFTWSMIDMFKTGMKELNLSDTIPVITYFKFKDLGTNTYDYIFCDEVQDLPESILVLMKNRLKHKGKIIVSGDSNQSIYELAPGLMEPTVNPDDIGKVIDADEIGLNYVHRVTRTIINAIQKLLPRTNIWAANREFTPPDRSIALYKSSRQEDEVKYVFEEALKGPNSSGRDKIETSVILLPRHDEIINFIQILLSQKGCASWTEKKDRYGKNPDYDDLNRYLASNSIKLQYVGNGKGSLQDAERNRQVIIMTYHSSKGLDFDNVFLPFLSWDLSISKTKSDILLMVAMTRSKKNLTITYSGNPHALLEKFINDDAIVTPISVNNNKGNLSNLNDIELDF